jgi:ribonucleoside-diphosphate reductase alpha chain
MADADKINQDSSGGDITCHDVASGREPCILLKAAHTRILNAAIKALAESPDFRVKVGDPVGIGTGPVRRRLPDERKAITHKIEIAGHEGYITVGLYEDGAPGEIFLVMAKEGSTMAGWADVFAIVVSIALQYGVPLQMLVDKFTNVRFEPSGMTRYTKIHHAKSFVDYIFRWLAIKFLPPGTAGEEPAKTEAAPARPADAQDGPPCNICGTFMVPSGSGYKCKNCGATLV